jgi:DNA-binding PadR family transcriptional regulator
MAPQDTPRRSRPMLDIAVLGLLKERAMHGYELRKQLIQRLGFFWTVSFGSLYPTLRKLEREGWVSKEREAEEDRPARQAGTGRRKQVYRITPDGEREFLTMLAVPAGAEVDKFTLRLAFFRYLRPEVRIRLLERRKAYLHDRLEEGAQSLASAKKRRADTYTLSLMRHGIEVTERDIEWLDELIATERGSEPEPAQEPPEAQAADEISTSTT